MTRFKMPHAEPELAEMMDDPIVRLLMKRDGVEEDNLMPMLHLASKRLRSERIKEDLV